jgi:adenine-specific DNA-methyltransferase
LLNFREDHTEPPIRKSHIRPITYEFDDEDPEDFNEDEVVGTDDELATQVRGTYFYKQSQVAVKYLRNLMSAKVFDNPKDHEELARLIKYVCGVEDRPIVLDFFAGSAASAEAVLRLNEIGYAGMKFISVQLPEQCDEKSKSGKAALAMGLRTIADVARERIRRVLKAEDYGIKDVGFRAFKIAPSNYRLWIGVEEKDAGAAAAQIEAFADSLVLGWKPENVIWEVALREGYSLTSRIEKIPNTGKNNFFCVTDPDREQSFVICLDDALTLEAVRALKLPKNALFVCRDTALDDTLSANLALQCRLKVL